MAAEADSVARREEQLHRAAGVRAAAAADRGIPAADGILRLADREAAPRRQLREDDPDAAPLHPGHDEAHRRARRLGHDDTDRRREHAGRHLRSALPRDAAQGHRRGLLHRGHRPQPAEVAVDAHGALDRGHGVGLRGRRRDARHLRRLRREPGGAAPQPDALGAGRPPGGQQHALQHRRGADIRPRSRSPASSSITTRSRRSSRRASATASRTTRCGCTSSASPRSWATCWKGSRRSSCSR